MEINKKSIKNISRKIIKSIILVFYSIFLGSLIIGGIAASIMTLIPDEASKPCYLGYYAHCSYTPFSTLILVGMAIIGSILLKLFITYLRKQYNKFVESKLELKSLI